MAQLVLSSLKVLLEARHWWFRICQKLSQALPERMVICFIEEVIFTSPAPWSVQPKRYVDEETTQVGLSVQAHTKVAGRFCKRRIASALRACENWSIDGHIRVQNHCIFSRCNRIETVMIPVPLDVLKQYFGMFVNMRL